MPGVGVIVLAAGGSVRLGRPKQSVIFRGETLLHRAARTATASAADAGVVVVLGAEAEAMAAMVDDLPVEIARNRRWESGMGGSIQAGMARLNGDAEAVVLMTCDQPLVTPEVLNGLIQAFRVRQTPIAASQYGGGMGVPALFSRRFFGALRQLRQSQGAKQLIQANLEAVVAIPFPAGAIDVDTPADVQYLFGLGDEMRVEIQPKV